MARSTASKDNFIKVGNKIFDKKSTIEGLRKLREFDVNEQLQKNLVQLERDSNQCSSDTGYQAVKLEKEIKALNTLKVIEDVDYMSFSDQIEHTTDNFRRHCKCFNTQIGDETFP